MKKLKFYVISSIIITQFLLINLVNAGNNVTTFGYSYGIVDDNQWFCKLDIISNLKNNNFNLKNNRFMITGEKGITQFSFLRHGLKWNFKEILKEFANFKSLIISGISIKQTSKEHKLISGSYFNSESSGYFLLYVMPEYAMFIKYRSLHLGEAEACAIMSEPITFITPLLNL